MVGGYPGYPLARSGWWGGGRKGDPLDGRGYQGTLWPGLDGGGVPKVPTGQVWCGGGYPGTGWGTLPPIRQSSIASTCYAAGGMPLAFTQEDFLVSKFDWTLNVWTTWRNIVRHRNSASNWKTEFLLNAWQTHLEWNCVQDSFRVKLR